MITLKFLEKSNWRTLMKYTERVEAGVGVAAKETADALVNDIRSNWSASRQTIGSGTAPAMDTGNLDSSIRVENTGRDEKGRFAGKDAVAWYIHVDTMDGNNNMGRGNYAMALEDPDYYNLPFIAPAIERSGELLVTNIKRFAR